MSFGAYLKGYSRDKNNAAHFVTHTRIGSNELGIPGGAYYVSPEKRTEFYNTYYERAYLRDADEYLTECQLRGRLLESGSDVAGGILIDLDFRYSTDVTERQHTAEQITDMVTEYTNELKKYFVFDRTTKFEIFVLEKPNVNREPEKTKDGIHMIIGLQADHVIQRMLRTAMMPILEKNIFDALPLTNEWETVMDEGITKGTTNWQLYGSHKPGNESYRLTYHYEATYDESDKAICLEEYEVPGEGEKLSREVFMQLTAQYDCHPKFPMQEAIKSNYSKMAMIGSGSGKRANSNSRVTPTRRRVLDDLTDDEGDDQSDHVCFTSFETVAVREITNQAKLDQAIDLMLSSFSESMTDYDLPEIHAYTQILPEMFYRPGSHELNRKVAFALKHTDERLFLSWIKLRSKAADFDYGTIPDLFRVWKTHFNASGMAGSADDAGGPGGTPLTKRSIIFWARQYADKDAYEAVKNTALNVYIDATIKYEKEHPEYDIASVLYHLYKDQYVYVVYGKASVSWKKYVNHRWAEDSKGTTLRNKISTTLYKLYEIKQTQLANEKAMLSVGAPASASASASTTANAVAAPTTGVTADQNETLDITELEKKNRDRDEYLKRRLKSITALMIKLKTSKNKNAIMREAEDLFLDEDFVEKSDENKYLLGFKNGVYDFKERVFRPGHPSDYITMSTNAYYTPIDMNDPETKKKVDELNNIINCIFPVVTLREYMWAHWASMLLGVNLSQTINFYLGNGCNGKSIVTDLIKLAFGDYSDKVSIQFITDERGKMGQASPEIAKLKGLRHVNMSEPRKGAILNDGVTKEITGDSTIEGRGLYQDSQVFAIQSTFTACMNNLLKVETNDDGIWRRLRVCMFMSKFAYPHEMEAFKKDNQFVYPRDDDLNKRLIEYAPYFMAMLIDIVCKTGGVVKDCDEVLAASRKYRKGQDYVCAFMDDMIEFTDDKTHRLKKTVAWDEFKKWYVNENGATKQFPIKSSELYEILDKKYGTSKASMWYGVRVKYDTLEDVEEEED